MAVNLLSLGVGSASHETPIWEGTSCQAINSRLRPKPERDDPRKLCSNGGQFWQGSITQGSGFLLEPAEAHELLEDARLRPIIKPYLGGAEVNSHPEHEYDRYAINFGALSLAEAEKFPRALEIVRQRVKPGRDGLRNDQATARTAKQLWWRFWAPREELYAGISGLRRCLVNSQVSKHLVFAYQPTNRIFGHTLYVYPFDSSTPFAVVQSRAHELWARLLSSTLEDRAGTGRLRYSASDCFETFPFPQPDPRTVIPDLECIGEKLYEARAKYMVDADQGLTKTYNALKDPSCTDERILELRHLHEEMDRAVLRAYPKLPAPPNQQSGSDDPAVRGWSDIPVPPFCIATDEDAEALQAFEDEVIDRLFVLNEIRAKEEAAGAAKKTSAKKPPAKRKAKPSSKQGKLI